jgi:hypothetical protein
MSLPPGRPAQLADLVRRQIFDKLSPTGTMSGDVFKGAESEVGRQANIYSNSPIGDERTYGDALQTLQANLRDLLTRSNPAQAQDLANANMSWALMKRAQRASSYLGAPDGVFTPAQLDRAISAQTPESRFTAGQGLMQPYAEAGKSVLGLPPATGEFGGGALGSGLAGAAIMQAVENPHLAMYGVPLGLNIILRLALIIAAVFVAIEVFRGADFFSQTMPCALGAGIVGWVLKWLQSTPLPKNIEWPRRDPKDHNAIVRLYPLCLRL